MSRQAKLNSMRLLESKQLAYTLHTFPDGIHSASGVAAALGIDPARVYKTLVGLTNEGRPVLVMLAAERSLDGKALARAIGVKRVAMASQAEAERLTGLKVGGISALALAHKRFATYLDAAATQLAGASLLVSAGQRGMNLELTVEALLQATGARIVAAGVDRDEPS
ncbi:MAG: aminoacyl-tRNA deacylase [Caldilineae bacterium]|nr:aminoacyl-tRNA deacylase [Chloroflexota bacterium]MCB9177496.1 aminoacyl-tRNA deacylase [Caldilineae bacterium]